ncbi:reverse transcriptase zinc-binding domain-containing protein, partial [Tanacetum coccineum]
RPKLDEHLRDNILWRKEYGNLCKFSVKQAYVDLLEDAKDVVWWKMIWFSQNIPKHAFILWMAVLNKLSTQDKIKQWGSFDVMRCSLCKKDTDSHSHLFFECEFSKALWEKVIWKIGVDWKEANWNNNVESFAKKRNVNSINNIIRRICLAASVYLVWQERNNRIFRDEMRSPDELYKILEEIIRMRFLSLKVKDSLAVRKAQEVWNVQMNIIENGDLQ